MSSSPTAGRRSVEALSGAASRGARVRGLLWHAHTGVVGSQVGPNRMLALAVNRAGGEVLLDQRVLPFGCHHQKMVVVRHPGRPQDDVAFLGGIDLDHGSRDDADHRGDRQSVGADPVYGPNPAYHDVQLELQGPVVREAEETFRERWQNPAAVSRLPWHVIPDRIHGLRRTGSPLPPASPAPPATGTCAVQLLRTYPRRRPRYPYAPRGERSIALAYTKALGRAEQLIYVEDQYLWSFDVARIFAAALQRSSRLHLIAVVPRRPDNENQFYNESAMLGHAEALAMVREAGGDRVQVLDVENLQGLPVYVHSKLCIVDDVWAAVGSDNFNTRSWTHDSELTAAVLDSERDQRAPIDPGGLGDGARRFARELRLTLMREHLDLDEDDDLLDPVRAADTVRKSAAELDAWHDGGLPRTPTCRATAQPPHRQGRQAARPASLAHRPDLPVLPRPGRSPSRYATAAHLLNRPAVLIPARRHRGARSGTSSRAVSPGCSSRTEQGRRSRAACSANSVPGRLNRSRRTGPRPTGHIVPKCTGTAWWASSSARKPAARTASRCPEPNVGPQPPTGRRAMSQRPTASRTTAEQSVSPAK